nr:retrotransposon protein, putative, unclassified [Tanacetum cinerariifolium]
MVISKLKERIKSISGQIKEDTIKMKLKEIKTINIKLDHMESKLVNEHLKQTYKQLYDLIKSTRIRLKEQCDDLINQVNLKSVEISDLNASLQEKVLHSKLNVNSKVKCVTCNGCMFSDNHDLCVLDFINNMNARVKSKSVKKNSKRKEVNCCKPVVTLVYSRKPMISKSTDSVSKSEVVQIVLWYLDSACSKHIIRDRSQLTNFVNKFLGTVKFRNDQVAKILGYGDYHIGNVMISRVGISHETSIAHSSQQNGVVERRNHTLIEAAHTMRIIETIHVDFDELTTMASEQSSSGSVLHERTPVTISSGLVPNLPSLTPVDHPAPEVIALIAEVVALKPAALTGLQISQSPRGIFINQSKYALEYLKKYNFDFCNPVNTPMVEKSKLDGENEGKDVDPSHYRDVNHAGFQNTCRSTSGSMQFLVDRLVSWLLKRQKSAAISSMEAKYIALSGCCAQVFWMRSYLTDYGLRFNKIPMYCDNKSAIDLCYNNVQHSRSKHIDIRFHFIKEHVKNGVIELYFVNTEYQLVDIFTKALGKERIKFLINKLGMRSFTPKTLKQLAYEVEE